LYNTNVVSLGSVVENRGFVLVTDEYVCALQYPEGWQENNSKESDDNEADEAAAGKGKGKGRRGKRKRTKSDDENESGGRP
jgi:hypothetical protein